MNPTLSETQLKLGLIASIVVLAASTAQADLTHRYDFSVNANDILGSAHGTLNGVVAVAGGQLQLNNPNFSNPGPFPNGGYLSLPPSILPSSGSVTIEQWFTFTGSGFFTEAYTFSDRNGGLNPPGAMV